MYTAATAPAPPCLFWVSVMSLCHWVTGDYHHRWWVQGGTHSCWKVGDIRDNAIHHLLHLPRWGMDRCHAAKGRVHAATGACLGGVGRNLAVGPPTLLDEIDYLFPIPGR